MPNFSLNERRQSVSPKSDWVTVGKIVGVWGIEGLLKVRSLTSVGGRLSVGSVVFIVGNPHKIESERPTKSGLILGLENLNDRTEAETIVGLFLEVPLSYVRPSQIDGNFYHFEIIDSDVYDENGMRLGAVIEILETGANDVYVVGSPNSREILIPATQEVVRSVDTSTKTIVVRLPDGI